MKKFFILTSFIFALSCILLSCNPEEEEKDETFTVSLYANDGKTVSALKQYTNLSAGSTINLPTATELSLVRNGYAFTGWGESADASAYKYVDGTQITVNSTFSLYAVWKKIETVSYYVSETGNDNNNGTSSSPYATLSKAIQNIQSKYVNYVFYISGSINDSVSFVDTALSPLYAKSVTISGSDNATDMLVGTSGSSVIRIQAAIPFSITKLTVKGGTGYTSRNGTSFGGGVYISASDSSGNAGSPSVSFNDVVITGNAATYGAGIYNVSGALTLTSTTVSGNTADSYGGGIYISDGSSGATLSLSGSTVSTNSAENGGGIYIESGTLTIADSSFITENTATKNGGGIYNIGVATLDGQSYINKNTVSDGSTSSSCGGGVYNKKTFTLSAGSISDNTSDAYGGGVYNASGAEFSLASGSVSTNTALFGGGLANEGTAVLKNGFVNLNTASYGGGLYAKGGTLTMEATTITGKKTSTLYCYVDKNTATEKGGGAYLDGGTLAVTAGVISGYGKRLISGNYSYTGNKAGENKSLSAMESYADCGNAWYRTAAAQVSIEGTAQDALLCDDDVTINATGWAAIVTD